MIALAFLGTGFAALCAASHAAAQLSAGEEAIPFTKRWPTAWNLVGTGAASHAATSGDGFHALLGARWWLWRCGGLGML